MEKEIYSLRQLPPGKSARVLRVDAEESQKERLAELGLFPGAEIRCLFSAPAGDPRAYQLRGFTLALRNRDSSRILIRTDPE
ncbi:MAG: FeoA family protein [Bacillota bacterium]|nr:FeoA family protein [Bacillota bacterium]